MPGRGGNGANLRERKDQDPFQPKKEVGNCSQQEDLRTGDAKEDLKNKKRIWGTLQRPEFAGTIMTNRRGFRIQRDSKRENRQENKTRGRKKRRETPAAPPKKLKVACVTINAKELCT